MNSIWIDIIHVYFPVTVAVSAQLVFLLLPVNLRTWQFDRLNACTYSGIQTFAAGLLFVVVPRVFDLFELPESVTASAIFFVFIASWWKILRTIPLEATAAMESKPRVEFDVSFESFYNPDRLRQLGELRADDTWAVTRHKALREMLVRRRVDQNMGESEDV